HLCLLLISLLHGCSHKSNRESTTASPRSSVETFTTEETGEPMRRGQVQWNEGQRSTNAVTITLDHRMTDHSKYQTIHGFGGSFTQAAAYLYKNLDRSTQEQFMKLVFSPEGLHYSLGRVPINSCDFSPET
ncbi:glucosylceramidase, putative, partial [Perkinsus marinus ATCC 50983]